MCRIHRRKTVHCVALLSGWIQGVVVKENWMSGGVELGCRECGDVYKQTGGQEAGRQEDSKHLVQDYNSFHLYQIAA